MNKLVCKNCGNNSSFELKGKIPHTGIYCKICGYWIKWANKLEIEQFRKQCINEVKNSNNCQYDLHLNVDLFNLELLKQMSTTNTLFYKIDHQTCELYFNNKLNILRETYDFNSHTYVYSFGYFIYNYDLLVNDEGLNKSNPDFIEVISLTSNDKAINLEAKNDIFR